MEGRLVIIMDKKPKQISVLLPTRGRTEALAKSLFSLTNLATKTKDIEIMIGFDQDDRTSIEYFIDNIQPTLVEKKIDFTVMEFEPLGYIRLNEYVNELAKQSKGNWLMFWNDDAIMETKGWDKHIVKHNGTFCVLRMPTHNEHPYAIFPIVPREWLNLFGYLSAHQISDAWISQIAYLVDIMVNIPVSVVHDRHDLTGNNLDSTYKNRPMLEGNHKDPRDFNHADRRQQRMKDAIKIANYIVKQGRDVSWLKSVVSGKQNPWEKMLSPEFDPNKQLTSYNE